MIPLFAILVGGLCASTGLVVLLDPRALYDHRPLTASSRHPCLGRCYRRRWRLGGGVLLALGVLVTAFGFASL